MHRAYACVERQIIEYAVLITATWGQQIEEHSCCCIKLTLRCWDERQLSNTDAFQSVLVKTQVISEGEDFEAVMTLKCFFNSFFGDVGSLHYL